MNSWLAPPVHWLAHASGVSNALAQQGHAARILMYHGVTTETAGRFAAQIEYLMTRYSVVPLRTVLERLRSDEPAAGELALTFDDGLRNNAAVVYPILRRLDVTATFFVCPGLIDARRWLWNHEARERMSGLPAARLTELCRSLNTPATDVDEVVEWMKALGAGCRAAVEDAIRAATPDFAPTPSQREQFDLMDWSELGSLDPDVIEIGSHTVNHVILTALDEADAEVEIVESRVRLEERLRRRVDLFAYPNGDYDTRVHSLVRQHYAGAVSTVQAMIRPGDDPHCLARIPAAERLPLLAWRLHRPAG